ncbi:phage tail protein [Winogradskya humida]|uniref:Fibronectin type-III domain-containing protein n=1 Tax=Winogradskya humida TaxID=113566 RepID=A0ABQ3ZYG9_9ACTN|nr:phage tail protein [Actinoplanes humidus]GIE23638.1 hypothetical protein Ahu01nite_067400 [Actinoplanes humidus]
MTAAIVSRAPVAARALPRLAGREIELSWTNPPVSAFGDGFLLGVRVVRRERTFPLLPDDGDVVHDEGGPVVDRLADTGLTPLTRYYYTVFAYDGTGFHTGEEARASALATDDHGLAETLFRLLPAVHQRDDVALRPDEIHALAPAVQEGLRVLPPELRGRGQLRRFLAAATAPLALVRSTAEALPQLHDVDRVPPDFLPLLAAFLDWRPDRTLPVFAQRNEVRAAPQLYRSVGSVPNLRSIVTRYTGFTSRIVEFGEHLARSTHAPAQNVFALRLDDAAPVSTLVTLDGAARGRLAVVPGSGGAFRLFHAAGDPLGPADDRAARRAVSGTAFPRPPVAGEPGAPVDAGRGSPFLTAAPVSVVQVKAFRGGTWGGSVPLFPGGEPAAAALPAGRILLAWVDRPGLPDARVLVSTGTTTGPAPAVLTGHTGTPFAVAHGSFLLVRDGTGTARAAQFARTDFADPAAASVNEVVTLLNTRLGGLVTASVAGGGALRLTSAVTGGDARLEVDLANSSAAAALGFGPDNAVAAGDWSDAIGWDQPRVLDTIPAGRLADLAAVTDGAGVRLAYARHDGTAWQVRTIRFDGTVWSGDEALTSGALSSREPSLGRDPDGRVWAVWARQGSVGGAGWSLRQRNRPASGAWSAETALTDTPAAGTAGDREPGLAVRPGLAPQVFFRSDRAGGTDLWAVPIGGSATRVTSGVPTESWPAPVTVGAEHWLLHRSDRSVSHAGVASSGAGAGTGTARRYAGSTTVVLADTGRRDRMGAFDDLVAYTPQRPGDGLLRGDEVYSRGSVGLFLSRADSAPLGDSTVARLRGVLDRFLPITVRAVIRPLSETEE